MQIPKKVINRRTEWATQWCKKPKQIGDSLLKMSYRKLKLIHYTITDQPQ